LAPAEKCDKAGGDQPNEQQQAQCRHNRHRLVLLNDQMAAACQLQEQLRFQLIEGRNRARTAESAKTDGCAYLQNEMLISS
jgi:hypothetical protein